MKECGEVRILKWNAAAEPLIEYGSVVYSEGERGRHAGRERALARSRAAEELVSVVVSSSPSQ
jgi:hypothetical protein